ncbi:MAG: acyl-ACP--UDP-N-acetylglucosamine O-acyltransferase [Candidatus Eiseniibacteriota bacterium]
MANVHPLAVVDPGAKLASDVTIGPFCWVGPDVTLEAGVVLDSNVRIEGHTAIGPRVHVHAGAVLGGPPQDLKFRGVPSFLMVGEETVIRECVTANVATDEGASTRIGAHCLVMAYAHVAHNTVLEDKVILANAVQLAGYVTVQENAIVGGAAVVHQFVRIGRHSMVGGGLRVPQDILPFTRAAGYPLRPIGLNTVGLERRGFSPDAVAGLKQAYRLLLRSGLRLDEAASRIRAEVKPLPEVEEFLTFALTSERGIAR